MCFQLVVIVWRVRLRYWLLPALIVRGVVCSLRFEEDHTTGASFASVLKRISLTQTQAALCFLKLFSRPAGSSRR